MLEYIYIWFDCGAAADADATAVYYCCHIRCCCLFFFFKYQITNGDDIDSSVMMTWKRARQIRTPSRTANPFQTKCLPIKSLSVISFTSDNSNDLFTKSLNYIFIHLMIQIFAVLFLVFIISFLLLTRSHPLVLAYSLSPVRPLSLSFQKISNNNSVLFFCSNWFSYRDILWFARRKQWANYNESPVMFRQYWILKQTKNKEGKWLLKCKICKKIHKKT